MKREESENCDTVRDTDPGTAQAAWDADRALVRRARAGDPEAVENLARRMLCIPRILDLLARRTGPFRDADERADAVQEVASRVWSALDRYQGRAGLETWIYGFCSLTLIDLRRARSRARRREQPLESDTSLAEERPEPFDGLDALEVQAAIGRLPADEAAVVEGRLFEGLTFEEFARRDGSSPNTAKTRYYRALDRLRGWLHRSFGEAGSPDGPRSAR